jgi:hypothetical protein
MDELCSKRNRVNPLCIGYVFSAQKRDHTSPIPPIADIETQRWVCGYGRIMFQTHSGQSFVHRVCVQCTETNSALYDIDMWCFDLVNCVAGYKMWSDVLWRGEFCVWLQNVVGCVVKGWILCVVAKCGAYMI